MTYNRPEYSTVTLWDDLDKLAEDYRELVKRLNFIGVSVVDRKFLERTADQLAATRNQVSDGSIEHTVAIAVMQAADRMFPLARGLVRARTPGAWAADVIVEGWTMNGRPVDTAGT